MRITRSVGVMALLAMLVVPVSLGFAYGGAGGLTYGLQYAHPQLTNESIGLHTTGGYGYGTGRDGRRTGGFGLAIFSETNALMGGVGGSINGHEFVSGPLSLAVNLWTGIGGAKADLRDPGGYLILFGELNAEVGLSLRPWMQLVAFGGMQGIVNLVPGTPLYSAVYYSPVWGFRIAWGAFR